jgi:hypothetical protein
MPKDFEGWFMIVFTILMFALMVDLTLILAV